MGSNGGFVASTTMLGTKKKLGSNLYHYLRFNLLLALHSYRQLGFREGVCLSYYSAICHCFVPLDTGCRCRLMGLGVTAGPDLGTAVGQYDPDRRDVCWKCMRLSFNFYRLQKSRWRSGLMVITATHLYLRSCMGSATFFSSYLRPYSPRGSKKS